jgi:hypothetical protein
MDHITNKKIFFMKWGNNRIEDGKSWYDHSGVVN